MGKKIQLTPDDYDSLTRVIDQDVGSRTEELKSFASTEDRKDARQAIRNLKRLNNKILAMYRQSKGL